VLCVPLELKSNILGVIYVDNRLQAGIFTPADQELLVAIASNAAIAIENARLYELAVEKGRLEREMQMAFQVQSSLLPKIIPQIPGWELAARWLPARQVSGDFYDFPSTSPRRLDVLIADVSDKGMPAALFMALTRTILRASLAQARSPRAGIERANRLIYADSADSMFVTLFYAQIDPRRGEVAYVNAGHNPPLAYHCGLPEGARVHKLSRTGMALGVMPENIYPQQSISLNPGDFIILYTDGVVDAESPQGEPFGFERLQEVILEGCARPVGQIISSLEQALAGHVGEQEPFDDITIVCIKRL